MVQEREAPGGRARPRRRARLAALCPALLASLLQQTWRPGRGHREAVCVWWWLQDMENALRCTLKNGSDDGFCVLCILPKQRASEMSEGLQKPGARGRRSPSPPTAAGRAPRCVAHTSPMSHSRQNRSKDSPRSSICQKHETAGERQRAGSGHGQHLGGTGPQPQCGHGGRAAARLWGRHCPALGRGGPPCATAHTRSTFGVADDTSGVFLPAPSLPLTHVHTAGRVAGGTI